MSREEILHIIAAKINQIKNENKEIMEEDYLDFRGIGLNSIELLTLIVHLENELEFETDDADLSLSHFSYVKDLIDSVYEKINQGRNF